jgi:hypothetical protein
VSSASALAAFTSPEVSAAAVKAFTSALPGYHGGADIPREVQNRKGESERINGFEAQLRSIVADPGFWEQCAEYPNNRIHDVKAQGRPLQYPDWLFHFIAHVAGTTKTKTVQGAIATLSDPCEWDKYSMMLDAFVPRGWTKISDLRERQKKPLGSRHAKKGAIPIRVEPPKSHHYDYFLQRLEKTVTEDGEPLLDVLYAAFERSALSTAHRMDLLARQQDLNYWDPDPRQFVGFDGTVFAMSKNTRNEPTCELHEVGSAKGVQYGTKYVLSSIRLPGVYASRIILQVRHVHADHAEPYRNEGEATVKMALGLRDRTMGHMKGIVVDSCLGGEQITELQNSWVTVVNHAHALRNPNRKKGGRYAKGRVEKSHIARVHEHEDAAGNLCTHAFYWIGGHLAEELVTVDGELIYQRVENFRYEARGNKDLSDSARPIFHKRREYFVVTVSCPHGEDSVARIPLFHFDATSSDPSFNRGTVVRVFAPEQPNFMKLYNRRNDTESRHADLKRRVSHLSAYPTRQRFRLMTAASTHNAFTWQQHLLQQGLPNAIDPHVGT